MVPNCVPGRHVTMTRVSLSRSRTSGGPARTEFRFVSVLASLTLPRLPQDDMHRRMLRPRMAARRAAERHAIPVHVRPCRPP